MTRTQEYKLARLKGRATLYEATITNSQTGRAWLLAYMPRTMAAIRRAIWRWSGEIQTFTGADVMTDLEDGSGIQLAGFVVRFSGRTQREAIMAGELDWWKAGTPAEGER